MTWHVLLFGAATDGLAGVSIDLRRMQTLVERSGLPGLELSVRPAATRAVFAGDFTRLCAVVRPGDGVLVYFSGHGLRLRDPTTGQRTHALALCGATPAPPDEFAYVLQEELCAWFWQISAVTANVTWIADCCHAARVFRGERRGRGLEERRREFLARRQKLLDQLPAEAFDPDGNPHVVRACAAAGERLAFEDPVEGGHFTRALTDTLADQAYRPILCEDLGRLVVRQLVRVGQTPTFAGPVRRWWLTDRQAPSRRFPTAVLSAGGTLLGGGALLDQRPGDRYGLLDRDGALLGTIVIKEVGAHRSRCEPGDPSRANAVGSTAVLRVASEPRGAVELSPDIDVRGPLAAALTDSGYLTVAGGVVPVVARVIVDGPGYRVLRPSGEQVGASTETHETIVATAEALARQAALLALRSYAPELLARTYRCVADARSIHLTNCSGRKIYVSAFELRPDGAIDLVTRHQPDGEACVAGEPQVIRLRREPAARGRRRVVVIVTPVRIDLRGWTGDVPRPSEVTRGDETPWCGVHCFELRDTDSD